MSNDTINPDVEKNMELPASGVTDKKNDSMSSTTAFSTNYKLEIAKELCTKYVGPYVGIPVVLIFALIGFASIFQETETYVQQGSSVILEGDAPLETKDPNNIDFDGRISASQTRGRSMNKLLENVADVDSPYSMSDVPFYWEVAGSGGNMGSEMCKCFNINMATSFGQNDIGNPSVLQPMPIQENTCSVYNVNLGTHTGTERAKRLGLNKQITPDFISSPFLPEVLSTFTKDHKGRIIMAVPNTAARVNMSYNYLQNKGLFQGSFLEFVSSKHILANNYLTHVLSGKWRGVTTLTEEDLITAVNTLKKKFIVARWADNRKIVQYLMQNEQWDESGYQCMYPPENPYSQEAAQAAQSQPPPPPPEKTAEEIASEAAISMHNYWDDRLFDLINEQSSNQLASML